MRRLVLYVLLVLTTVTPLVAGFSSPTNAAGPTGAIQGRIVMKIPGDDNVSTLNNFQFNVKLVEFGTGKQTDFNTPFARTNGSGQFFIPNVPVGRVLLSIPSVQFTGAASKCKFDSALPDYPLDVIQDQTTQAGDVKLIDPVLVTPPSAQPADCVPPGAADGDIPPPTCDAGGFTIIICGAIQLTVRAADWIRDSILLPLLEQRPLSQSTEEGKPLYTMWSAFRNVASIFFILIFFALIFGTAFGMDNYTVKKTLPRLIAGAVFVPLSWYLCVFMVDMGNVIGQGLLGLTATIIPNAQITFETPLSQVFFGGGIVLIGVAAIGALATLGLGIALTVFFALLAAFITIVMRQMIIYILIVLSPFAVLAWILPNTTRWWTRWYTMLFRLIMVYPIILMLFEAGRLFAYVAEAITQGTIGTAVAAGPFFGLTPEARPFASVVGLYAPTVLVPGVVTDSLKDTPGGVGNAIQKGRDALNRRYGRGSNFDNKRAMERQHKNLIRMDNAEKKGSVLRAAMWRARSGTGSGIGGFTKGGVVAKMERNELKNKAIGTAAKYNANARANQIMPAESANDRIAAETTQELDRIAADRAQRAGIRQAVSQIGHNADAVTRARYAAGVINANKAYSQQAGKDVGTIRNAAANNLTAPEIINHTANHEAEHQAQYHGQVTRGNQTFNEIDEEAVAAGHATSIQNAQINRLRSESENAGSKEKLNITAHHGTAAGENVIDAQLVQNAINTENARRARIGAAPLDAAGRAAVANQVSRERTQEMTQAAFLAGRQGAADADALRHERVETEHLRGESNNQVLRSSQLVARDKVTSEKAARLERLQASDPTAGGTLLSRQQVLDAAHVDAKTAASAAVGDKIAALNAGAVAAREGENTASLIAAGVEAGELRRSNEAGARRGQLDSRDADLQKVAAQLRATGMSPAAAAANANRQRISERIKVSAQNANEASSAESGARGSKIDATAADLNTIAQEMTTARGGIAPTNAQVQAEYQKRLLKAGAIKGKQEADQKIGTRQGILDSEGQQNSHDADQRAARLAADASETKAAADRRGIVTGNEEARQRVIDRAAARGVTLTDVQAANKIRNSRASASEFAAEKRATQEIGADEGTNRGIKAAEKKVKKEAKRAGRTLTNEEARSAVLDSTAAAAAIDSSRKLIDSTAQERALTTDERANKLDDVSRLEATQRKAGKQLGVQAGELKGNINAGIAEAKKNGLEFGSDGANLASASRAGKAAAIDATARQAKSFANEQATINVDRTAAGRITAEQLAQQAEAEANVQLSKQVAKTKGSLVEHQQAIKRIQDAAAAAGKPIPNDAEAAKELIETAAVGAKHAARAETGKMYKENEGAAAGVARGITNIKNAAADAGTTLTDAQAEEQMYKTIRDQSERAGYNKVVGEVAEARGIAEARERQKEAARVEIAKRTGRAAADIDDAEVEEAIDRAADTTIVKDTRDRIIAGTGKEIGTLYGEEASVAEGAEKVLEEANKSIENHVNDELDKAERAKGAPLTATEKAAVESTARASAVRAYGRTAQEARNDARQNLATNIVRGAASAANLETAAAAGQARGAIDTADAALDREMNNTLANDAYFAEDVRGDDGTLYPAGEKVPAGTTLGSKREETEKDTTYGMDVRGEDGTIYKAGDTVPKGTQVVVPYIKTRTTKGTATGINRQQAVERVTQKAISGGQETGVRAQAAKQGSLAALGQAAGKTANVEDRLAAYTAAEADKLASETGGIQAQSRVIGTAMQRSFDQSVSETTATAFDRKIEQAVGEANDREVTLYQVDDNGNLILDAAKQPIPSDVTSVIGNIPHDGPGNATLMQIARDAKAKKDPATLRAALRRLGVAESGRAKLVELRNELFGGSPQDPATGIEDFNIKATTGENLAEWERAMERVNAPGSPDLQKPDGNAFKNITASKLAGFDTSTVTRYTEYIDRLRESAKRAAALGKKAEDAGKLAEAAEYKKKAKALWEKRQAAVSDIQEAHKRLTTTSGPDANKYEGVAKEAVQALLDEDKFEDWEGTSTLPGVKELYKGFVLPTDPADIPKP